MNFVFQKEKGEIDAWLADMDEAAMEQSIGEAAKALRVSYSSFLLLVPILFSLFHFNYELLSAFDIIPFVLFYFISTNFMHLIFHVPNIFSFFILVKTTKNFRGRSCCKNSGEEISYGIKSRIT